MWNNPTQDHHAEQTRGVVVDVTPRQLMIMTLLFRTLLLTLALSFAACGSGPENPAEAPETTKPVAAAASEPAPEVPQRKDEVAVAPPSAPTAPTPPVTNAATPDRDVVRTVDKPVIEGRDLPEPKETSTPPAPTPSTAPATAPTETPTPAPAPAPTGSPNAPAAAEAPKGVKVITPSHKQWDALLGQYVDSNGLVDYAGLKKNEAKLDAYLATLAKATPIDLWSHNEGLAYWINAYNAFTFKLILNNYPVGSITDLDGGAPWKVKWIKLGDKTYSLNNIEHDIIRPRYGDPRIHFAVVCAAKSCPPLLNKAFKPDMLNLQLDAVTRKFINNSNFNQVNGDVRVSKIFDWYKEDFGNLKDYLNQYLGQKIPTGKEIGFMDYDWSLNKQ